MQIEKEQATKIADFIKWTFHTTHRATNVLICFLNTVEWCDYVYDLELLFY